MGFAFLAFGHIDRCARQAHDFAALVAKGLDVQIVPPGSTVIRERNFRPLGLPRAQHFALYGHHGNRAVVRVNVSIGTSEYLLYRSTEYCVADRRVAEVAILRVDRHMRSAQSRFVAGKTRAQEAKLPSLRS